MWWQPHDWPPMFHSCAIIPPPVWSFAILRSKLYCGWWRRSFCPSICFDGDGWSVVGSGDDEDDNGKKKDKKEDDKNGWNIRMRTFSKMGIKKFMISNKEGVSRAEWKSLFISDPVTQRVGGPTFEPISISGTYEGFNGNFKPCVFERVPLRNWSGGILKAQLWK